MNIFPKIFLLLILTAVLNAPLSAQLPQDFIDVAISDSWEDPVGVTFDEKGRGYVWEKGGKVFLLDSADQKIPQPLIDISEEVYNWWDHGMLGFALDPYFHENGHFYLFYVVDRHHLLHYGTPRYEPDSTYYNQATIGRITRYTADPATEFSTTLAGSRKVLVGEIKENAMPMIMLSHGVGSLIFGEDGTLMASIGDSGSFTWSDAGSHPDTHFEQAIADGIMREEDNVGAFRAQMLNSLNGKIIRIDPETGDGVPSNPYFDADQPRSARSRIWTSGIRNAFRTILWPGTGAHDPADGKPGTLIAGDVGSIFWEELNVIREAGLNGGWPVFEGIKEHAKFANLIRENKDVSNPLFDPDTCNLPFFTFHDLIRQPGAPAFTVPCDSAGQFADSAWSGIHLWPELSWSNAKGDDTLAIVGSFSDQGEILELDIESPDAYASGENFAGFSPIPGFFYEGPNFPSDYQGKLFIADYSGWIKIFTFDDNQILREIENFHTDAKDVVHLALNPKTGIVYYITIEDHLLRKIEFGGNPPPVVSLEADQTYGSGDLAVQFDGSGSYAPKGWPISFHWEFGDGQESTDIAPLHIYQAASGNPQSFNARLTVTDSLGDSAVATQLISLNNTPPTARITSIQDGSFYALNGASWYPMEAEVRDAEHDNESLTYAWQTFLYHNTHNHPNPVDNHPNTGIHLDPLGCNGEEFSYLFTLTVTDPEGLSTSDEVRIFPNCEDFPAENLIFNGEGLNDRVRLRWSSSFERNLREYQVQRWEGGRFSTIGVQAAGAIDYVFEDENPLKGQNIYRLKLLRADGRFDYSSEVSVKYPPDPQYIIYPNPASDYIWVELKEMAEQVNFSLYASDGKLILTDAWSSSLPRRIPVGSLSKGIYLFKIDNGTSSFSGEILISR